MLLIWIQRIWVWQEDVFCLGCVVYQKTRRRLLYQHRTILIWTIPMSFVALHSFLQDSPWLMPQLMVQLLSIDQQLNGGFCWLFLDCSWWQYFYGWWLEGLGQILPRLLHRGEGVIEEAQWMKFQAQKNGWEENHFEPEPEDEPAIRTEEQNEPEVVPSPVSLLTQRRLIYEGPFVSHVHEPCGCSVWKVGQKAPAPFRVGGQLSHRRILEELSDRWSSCLCVWIEEKFEKSRRCFWWLRMMATMMRSWRGLLVWKSTWIQIWTWICPCQRVLPGCIIDFVIEWLAHSMTRFDGLVKCLQVRGKHACFPGASIGGHRAQNANGLHHEWAGWVMKPWSATVITLVCYECWHGTMAGIWKADSDCWHKMDWYVCVIALFSYWWLSVFSIACFLFQLVMRKWSTSTPNVSFHLHECWILT